MIRNGVTGFTNGIHKAPTDTGPMQPEHTDRSSIRNSELYPHSKSLSPFSCPVKELCKREDTRGRTGRGSIVYLRLPACSSPARRQCLVGIRTSEDGRLARCGVVWACGCKGYGSGYSTINNTEYSSQTAESQGFAAKSRVSDTQCRCRAIELRLHSAP